MSRAQMQKNAWQAAIVVAAVSIGSLIPTIAPVWAGLNLIINGKVASTDVRTINGKAYVPAADVAKALGMAIVKTGSGYEIKKAGGTYQVQGVTQGKVGDVLFDGKWRFQVLGIETPESFTLKSNSNPDYAVYRNVAEFQDRVFRPATGHKLVVLQCRITNAVKEPRALWVFNAETRTALADMAGTSHPPIFHDFEGAPLQSKPLLPGAKLDFALIFSVPQATQLKDLVFTLRAIGDKGNDVRVSLT